MAAVAPFFTGSAFVCPNCDAYAQQTWTKLNFAGGGRSARVSQATCNACTERSIWREYRAIVDGSPSIVGAMIWPVGRGGRPAPADLPGDVSGVYNEARDVVSASPKSAAALLRTALEGVLSGLYPDEGNLNSTIGAAVAAGLPQSVAQAMDTLRFSGNRIHELRNEDTAETVGALFDLLHIVVDRLITQPKQISEMWAGIPEGFKAQVERRDQS